MRKLSLFAVLLICGTCRSSLQEAPPIADVTVAEKIEPQILGQRCEYVNKSHILRCIDVETGEVISETRGK